MGMVLSNQMLDQIGRLAKTLEIEQVRDRE
jgi:hypothetical protein